jgi:paraquat-inducible protein B
MSKEPRYAWIGTFVIGAVAIVLAAVLFLGRGKFFENTGTYIAFFGGSVKGLSIGAPVSFRGAPVGKVKDVSIVYKPDRDELIIPVLLELDADSVRGLNTLKERNGNGEGPELVKRLIDKGLKAQLALDSIVTGQLFVQLDFMPKVPVRMMSGDDEDYQEIPTAPSPLEKLQETLQQLPISELVNKTVAALEKIDTILSSDDVSNAFTNLNGALVELKTLASNFDERSEGILKEFKVVIDQISATLQTVQTTLKDGAPLTGKASAALDEISNSARSLRRLADALEEHPEALLRGKR